MQYVGKGLLAKNPLGVCESIDGLIAAAILLDLRIGLLDCGPGDAVAFDDILGSGKSVDPGPILDEVAEADILLILEVLTQGESRLISLENVGLHIVDDDLDDDLHEESHLHLGILSGDAEDGEDPSDVILVSESNETLIHLRPEHGLLGTAVISI